jgi:hypothetical protein
MGCSAGLPFFWLVCGSLSFRDKKGQTARNSGLPYISLSEFVQILLREDPESS